MSCVAIGCLFGEVYYHRVAGEKLEVTTRIYDRSYFWYFSSGLSKPRMAGFGKAGT